MKDFNPEEAIELAILKSESMEPAGLDIPTMTHNIEKEGCNGLEDCPVCSSLGDIK